MAVEHLISASFQFASQLANECPLFSDGDRRINNPPAESAYFWVQRSFTSKRTIESPIQIEALLLPMPKHSHQPVLHRSAVEVFHDVQDRGVALFRSRGSRNHIV